ncbi:unnamed protein product [Caenorhabditis auriculariae]|uniref:Uncharacterized protein n=1 Tax=Caenorhabditis auriculariae TaxID=2777116 RepID=A0A8S1H6E5_9PELO|nr:unnamed protein product [Caenorhabditis auriculariae]
MLRAKDIFDLCLAFALGFLYSDYAPFLLDLGIIASVCYYLFFVEPVPRRNVSSANRVEVCGCEDFEVTDNEHSCSGCLQCQRPGHH